MNKILKNDFGQTKEGKDGFSWTTLFFGVFPAIFRNDWKYAGIMFIAAIFTFGFSWLIFPFIYNKLYTKDLIEKGFKPIDDNYSNYLRSKGIFIPESSPKSSSNQQQINNFKEDNIDKLNKLKDLKDKGVLTEEEFDRKKQEVIDKI